MTRLVIAAFVGVFLVAGAVRAAGTPWMVPFAIGAVIFAVIVTFADDRERRDLELWERRERLRDEKRRRAA